MACLSTPRIPRTQRTRQRGSTAVELALVLGLFISLLAGMTDLARWSLAAAALQEAAREGARVAAVCDLQDSAVEQAVRARLTGVAGAGPQPQVGITYDPSGCSAQTCTQVRVSITGAALQGVAPWWTGLLQLPGATVEITREALSSTHNGRSNPRCL